MRLGKIEGFTTLKNQIKANLIINIKKNENLKRRDMIVDKISSLLFYQYLQNFTLKGINLSQSESYYLKSKFAECENKKVKISNLYLLAEAFRYLKIIISILKCLTLRSQFPHHNKYLLVYSLTNDQVINKSQDSAANFFSTFFSKYKFDNILIESKLNVVGTKNVKFYSRNLDYFVKGYSRNIKVKLIRILFRDLLCVLQNVLGDYRSIISSSDFIEGKILNCIIQTKKIKVTILCTQTKLTFRPGIFYFSEKKNNKLLWYSDNSIPIVNKNIKSSIDLSYLRTSNIGEHLVFSRKFFKVLSTYNKNCVKIILPFSFSHEYPLKFNDNEINDLSRIMKSQKVISYFSITPQKGTSHLNFYSSELMITDLKAIRQAIMQSNTAFSYKCVLLIKPKRKISKHHSESYKKLLFESDKKVHKFILDPQEDILKILKYSDLVVCTPFTSVALIAKSLRKKVIFFSTTKKFDLPKNYESIRVIKSVQKLNEIIKTI